MNWIFKNLFSFEKKLTGCPGGPWIPGSPCKPSAPVKPGEPESPFGPEIKQKINWLLF